MVVEVKIKTDALDVARSFDKRYRKNKRFATAVALTKTAKRLKVALSGQMKQVFDRPKPFTTKGIFLKRADKKKLTAVVGLKTLPGAKNSLSVADILQHHFVGGDRKRKRVELWFQRAGYITSSEYLVPASAAKFDRYGNMSKGQVQQMLSQLRAGPDPQAYASNSARSQAAQRRAGIMFWSRGGRLPRGVWVRAGLGVKPVMLVVSRASYRKRIDLPKLANKVVRRHFDKEFRVALRNALRTAR